MAPFCRARLLLILLLPALRCLGDEVAISLPLDGFYHPGRYMPVRMKASVARESTLIVVAPGAMTTSITFHDPIDVVVPWLQIDGKARELSWMLDVTRMNEKVQTPLKALTDRQRLVGFAIPDEATAQRVAVALFPGDEIVPIRLNQSDAIPGNAAAWESLDGLIIDQSTAAGWDEERLSVLVACGIAVVVRGSKPPLDHWPWESLSLDDPSQRWWVLRHTAVGPRSARFDDAAYRPVASWRPGWPPEFRRRIVAIALAFSVLAIGLALWRPPMTAIWVAALSGVTLAGMGLFWKFQTPLTQCNGQVVVLDHKMAQIDDWLYQTSFRPIDSVVYWGEYSKPIFASLFHLQKAQPSLLCRPNGDPALFVYRVGSRMRTALLMRRMGPHGPVAAPIRPMVSPMLEMVKSMYLRPGFQLAGELPSTPLLGTPYSDVELWPAVVIERNEQTVEKKTN